MSNLKDELKRIEIPKNLHAHVRRGIVQATTEKQTKKQWLPMVVTVAVSIAVLFFVVMIATDVQVERTASVETESGEPNLYILAGVVTAVVGILAAWLLRVRPLWKRWIVVGCLISIVWIWGGTYYETQQLNDRFIAPLYVEVVKGEQKELRIQYVVDRRDEQKRIVEATIGNLQFPVSDELVRNEFSHQLLKEVYVSLDTSQWERLIGQQNFSNSNVLFNDGQRYSLPIEHLVFKSDVAGEPYTIENKTWPNSNGVGNDGYAFALFQLHAETAIQSVHYPTFPNLLESYELRAGSKVIKRVNYNGLEDVDLLPYTLLGEEMIQLDFRQQRTNEDFTMYDLKIIIEGAQQQYMYDFLLDSFVASSEVDDLKKELR